MLYVGGAYDDVNSYIYKLSAGGPTAVPTLVDTLAINFVRVSLCLVVLSSFEPQPSE